MVNKKKARKERETSIKVNFGLKDHLNEQSIAKLKEAEQEWKRQEREKQEEKLKKIAEARKAQEKNKTFADLFEESNLDWRSFK